MRLIERPLMLVTCLLILIVILVSQIFPSNPKFSYALGKKVLCEGFIDESPRAGEENTKLGVKLSGCFENENFVPLKERVQLTLNEPADRRGGPLWPPISILGGDGAPPLRYGDIVRFQTSFHLPTDFKNPGGFKFKRYCAMRGISALGFIDDPRWITKIGTVSGHYFRRAIENWRLKIGESLGTIQDKKLRSVAQALVIGDGSEINEETKNNFRRSGLMHLLVISGLNVAFVAGFVFFLFKWLILLTTNLASRFNIFKPAAVFSIIIIWIYAYLTGAEVSVVRAGIMATVYLSGIALDKRQDLLTTLALAAVIILANSPLSIYDVSFQLSFIAVLAIAIIYPKLTAPFKKYEDKRILWHVIQTIAASIAATIGATPLVAYYFHYSSFAGLIANIVAVPWAGFVITPLSLVVAFFQWPINLLGYSIMPLMKLANIAAANSSPVTLGFTPTLLSIFAFYFGVLIIVYRKNFVFRRGGVPSPPKLRVTTEGRPYGKFLTIVCAFIFISSNAYRHGLFSKQKLEVTFLDVGQGSSIVVRFPDRKVLVVDGGGAKKSDFDLGKFIIAPYLWHEGITHVDWLLLTHPHPDHYKGLGFIAEEFSPSVLVWNGITPEPEEAEEWEEFLERIKNANVKMETFGNVSLPFEILSPPAKIPSNWTMNDTSIVSKITDGEKTFFLAGDIEAEAEKYLVKSGKSLVADILQIPHHGSAKSSSDEFLMSVNPKEVVIQLGENNFYGFPKQEVLDRIAKIGAKIWRTDLDGTVIFK